MTLFVFDRLRETVELGPDSYSAPYARAVRYNSPSGQYIFGGSEYDTCYLVDSTYPPSLV